MNEQFIPLYRCLDLSTIGPVNVTGDRIVPLVDADGVTLVRLMQVSDDGSTVTSLPLSNVRDNADNLLENGAGLLAVVSRSQAFDGVNYDRIRTIPDNADAQAALTLGTQGIVARLQAWNGATFDRLRAASAAVQASFASHVGIKAVALAGNWSVQSNPAVNVQATISRAAGGAGVRHICTSILATLSAGATAGAAVKVYLRDGATGVGAILWSGSLAVPIGDTRNISLSGLSIVGSAATEMTLEFAAAGGVTTLENVSLTGYTVA